MTTTVRAPGPDAAAVTDALGRGDCGEVAGDAGRRAQYSADASNYRQIPLAVVFPRERQHVLNALSVCRSLGVPVTSRGAGTSTSGQAVGPGVVLDFSRYFNRLLALDPQARTATVQPGIVLDDLQRAASGHGLLFGADPSTHSRCTLGGMIGNNACGSHSLAWGRTADNVLELEVVTYRGTVVRLGEMSGREIDEATAAGGDRGQLIASLYRLAQGNLAALRTKLGQFPRQVSGYALEHLLPEHRFNLARALVGSEGTLAVVLSATVRLITPPPGRALVVLGFQDACAAADAVPALLEHRLLALEGLDQALTDIVTRPETRATIDTLPAAQAWLFAELGDTAAELPLRATELAEAARRTTGFTGSEIVTDPVRARRLWRIREDGAGLATRLPGDTSQLPGAGGDSEAWPGWEDAAVPPDQLGSYLRQFTRLLKQHDLQGAVYGHFGEGCLHVRINFDFTTERGTAAFRVFVTDAARLVAAHGGSLSGEHGDGQARSELLPLMYGPDVIALFEEFKNIWDPDNGLNPGMIVRPLPVDGNLRVSPHRTPLPLAHPTSLAKGFAFHADDGDFAKATRRCVGVGKCRSASHRGDVMCPSYRVTLDEKDSTRGRARLLYEMTQGEVITDGWRSTEVRDALDLCLSCKGCSADCPVGVDMATYKSEFLHHHYKGRVRPSSHYTMGWLPLLSRPAARIPGLVNALASSRLAPLLKRLGGVAAQREIPRFADETFLTWFRRRTPRGDGGRGPVMLWADSFNNHFTPEVLKAGVAVLESAGFRVRVPDGTQCCGLTWITTGQLGVARRVARRAVTALTPAVEAGIPVVGLEPSCAAALRTDLPELLDDDPARALARATVTLAELLVHRAPDWRPPRVEARSLSQTHCHQHATSGFGADSALLHRMGIDNTTLDSGCCGLAGNFGFERGHYDVSVAAGEQVLLPAVRSAARDTHILADGFSCRTQIAQRTDRTGTHLAQLIARALPPADTAAPAHPTPATQEDHTRD